MREADRLLAESQQWHKDWQKRKEQERRQAEMFPFLVRLVANIPFVVGFTLCLIWFF